MTQAGEHPHPEHLMAFVEKMAVQIGSDYVRRTAEFLKRDYPVTASALVPKLRVLYRKTRASEPM